MTTKCYAVEISSENESMFEDLDNYGFDYYCEEHWPAPGLWKFILIVIRMKFRIWKI